MRRREPLEKHVGIATKRKETKLLMESNRRRQRRWYWVVGGSQMRGAEEPMASADWKDQSRTRLSALLAAMAALLWKQKRHSLISSTLGHIGCSKFGRGVSYFKASEVAKRRALCRYDNVREHSFGHAVFGMFSFVQSLCPARGCLIKKL